MAISASRMALTRRAIVSTVHQTWLRRAGGRRLASKAAETTIRFDILGGLPWGHCGPGIEPLIHSLDREKCTGTVNRTGKRGRRSSHTQTDAGQERLGT